MSRLPSLVISTALIGAGGLAWAFAGRPLVTNPELNTPVNPLGIKCSPYGEVFAMAMQGPIDTYFDVGISGSAYQQEADKDGGEHEHEHEQALAATAPADTKPGPATLKQRLGNLLGYLDKASVDRTNPRPASEALKRYLRRQAEDKLRFAYQLDPAHYGNYNSLHFFLTEPAVGTRPELTPTAAKLAKDTIQYCLRQDHDPRPALTAAAAATNILHLMFSDQHNATPRYNTPQMRQCLAILDHCLARYTRISHEWDLSKNWELLSSQRITECEMRLQFIGKIRDAAEKTIIRLEAHPL
ncbi:MAG: hypothetical protein WCP45_04695 [Verrucomicrobiota bacterium]